MKTYKFIAVEKINLDKDNRMLRIGFGKNKATWFFRIDLWSVGYRFKKRNTEVEHTKTTFHQGEKCLPSRLITKQDIELVLNYYIPNDWDMSYEYIDGLYHVTITFKQPLLFYRISFVKDYINNHKMIGMIVNYI